MTEPSRGRDRELPGWGALRVRALPGFPSDTVAAVTPKQAEAVRSYAERLAAYTGEDPDAVEAEAWGLLAASGRVAAVTNLGSSSSSDD